MTPCAPGEIRIRNRRYRPYVEIAGVGFLTLIVSGVCGLFVAPWLEKIMLGCIFAGMLGILAIAAYGWLQVWDLRRSLVSQQGGTVFTELKQWLLGIHRRKLYPAGGAMSVIGLGWLLPTRVSILHLKLGDDIEIEPPLARFPAQLVARILFASDPVEDYAESAKPLCEATIAVAAGKQFHLIIDEADAQRLRQWAATMSIAIRHCDGYSPRSVEPAK